MFKLKAGVEINFRAQHTEIRILPPGVTGIATSRLDWIYYSWKIRNKLNEHYIHKYIHNKNDNIHKNEVQQIR